jgi:hypothetical protein
MMRADTADSRDNKSANDRDEPDRPGVEAAKPASEEFQR